MTDILLATFALLTAVNGFFGETVEKFTSDNPKQLLRRIRLPGWSFLLLSILTFSLGTYKTLHSFEARMHSAYPKFEDIVDQRTGHSLDDWEKFMSYRVTLRFELQQIYEKVFPGRKRPDSMQLTLQELGQRGAIPSSLCQSLDYIRWNTYYVEYGTEGPSPQELATVRKDALDALPKLARISKEINVQALQPDGSTPCGANPAQ
jgi:hypothetical protein